MIKSLTSKMRFFELFIENKNLIKQGLYLLEICQKSGWIDWHRDGSSWSRRTVMDVVVPYLMKFLLLLSSLPSTASMTDRHSHNGPSRVFVLPIFLQQMHYVATYGPSQAWRSVTRSLGCLFCISLLKNLRIHLWTVFLQIRRNLYKN